MLDAMLETAVSVASIVLEFFGAFVFIAACAYLIGSLAKKGK